MNMTLDGFCNHGYINQWTFDKTYTRPIVIDGNGNNLDSLLVGFTPTAFWGGEILLY